MFFQWPSILYGFTTTFIEMFLNVNYSSETMEYEENVTVVCGHGELFCLLI